MLLNLPNIDYASINVKVKQMEAAYGDGRTIVLDSINATLQELIEPLALKHPEWRFEPSETTRFNTSSSDKDKVPLVVTKFDVYFNRECLGSIGRERNYTRAEDTYVIYNERIEKSMQRGRSTKTGKLDKALRIVEKTFSPAKHDEVFDKLITQARSHLAGHVRSKEGNADRIWRRHYDEIRDYMLTRWDEFVAATPSTKLSAEIGEYPRLVEEFNLVQQMYNDAIHKESMYNIVISGSDYLVKHNGKLSIHDAQTLPESIRGKLGILKLVEDGQAVEGMGFRATENTYFVVGENNDLQG
jgi:hypothetical protein